MSTILTVRSGDLTVSNGGAQGGFGMHTDGIVQGTLAAVVAFWSPLHACGVEAPGLKVIKASRAKVMAYLRHAFPDKEIPGWCSHSEWESAFSPADLSAEFGPAWSPEMNPGDVIVFTNWTIHGSHVNPEMTKARSAVVQRWTSDKWREPSWFDRLTAR